MTHLHWHVERRTALRGENRSSHEHPQRIGIATLDFTRWELGGILGDPLMFGLCVRNPTSNSKASME